MGRMPEPTDRTQAATRVKLTYDDFVLFPDDGQRHELIDGEHYVNPAPNKPHQRISGRFHLAIGAWLEEHPIGQLFYAPLDVVLSRFDVVGPDLLYVSNERASQVLTPAHAAGAPDLVIEIGSPGTRTRDLTIKRQLYERSGVVEYWFVDPKTNVVGVYRLVAGQFAPVVELARERDDRLTTPLFSGLELSLTKLLRD
jgi:Uma2 family endonuclease